MYNVAPSATSIPAFNNHVLSLAAALVLVLVFAALFSLFRALVSLS